MSLRPYYDEDESTLYLGDALDVMAALPDASVDLVATDPPYFRVADEAWDRQWDDPEAFLAWIDQLCEQWARLLRPNGSLYVFASPDMAARVECVMRQHVTVLNRIRWIKDAGWHNKAEKESLRAFLSPWEEVVFAEKANPLGERLRQAKEEAGQTCDGIERALGYTDSRGRGSRLFYRWETGSSIPTEDDFCRALRACGSKMSDTQLREEFRRYCRPFRLTPATPSTDIWNFAAVQPYPGKHPCEKPLSLMRHIVEVSTRPGAVVLDSFIGSGTTAMACRELGRCCIGIDNNPRYLDVAANRLAQGVLFPHTAKEAV